ncbi:MAG TPA: alpha/beta hydrolase [Solirubrobacteraceae bacterium]|nr:alpha/beta hydrolase [Solirubrobacteraceae bacterium]
MARSFLILHGYEGSGPEHWQSWLAERLRRAGERVAYPGLPDPYAPAPHAWRAALATQLRTLRGELTVIAHSLACILWLQHCNAPVIGDARAARVLLVAPPSLAGAPRPIRRFFPVALERERVAAAAADTRLVCAPDDPYCPEDAAVVYGEPLGLAVDVLPGGGHINVETGYGPWPAAEDWCYGASAITSSRIAPG